MLGSCWVGVQYCNTTRFNIQLQSKLDNNGVGQVFCRRQQSQCLSDCGKYCPSPYSSPAFLEMF